MQKVKNDWCCYVCQYDSGVWTNAKSRYDADKWECHRLLKALKKVHAYLYKVFFIVELNAQTLVSQLNRSTVNIFDVLINCWIVWIWLFDFDILHVLNKKHQALNTLSQHSQTEDETDSDNSDIEDFLNSQLFHSSVQVYLVSTKHAVGQKLKLTITFCSEFWVWILWELNSHDYISCYTSTFHQHARQEIHKVQDKGSKAYCSRHEVVLLWQQEYENS